MSGLHVFKFFDKKDQNLIHEASLLSVFMVLKFLDENKS